MVLLDLPIAPDSVPFGLVSHFLEFAPLNVFAVLLFWLVKTQALSNYFKKAVKSSLLINRKAILRSSSVQDKYR